MKTIAIIVVIGILILVVVGCNTVEKESTVVKVNEGIEVSGDPESPSGYTITQFNENDQVIHTVEVDIVNNYEEGYVPVQALFCNSNKWSNPVEDIASVDTKNINSLYKIEQHFTYKQSKSVLYFFEVDMEVYCVEPLFEEIITIDTIVNNEYCGLYLCERKDFQKMQDITSIEDE